MILPWRAGRKKVNRRNPVRVERDWREFWRVSGVTVVMALLLGAAWGAWSMVTNPKTLPIKQLQLEGPFEHVSAEQMRSVVRGHVQAGFFSVDVDAVAQAMRALPWIDEVTVRRVWPDRLQVVVTEQKALARWAGGGVMNKRGELFFPDEGQVPDGLPLLEGPDSTATLMAKRYQELAPTLNSVGVAQMTLTPRRAWRMQLGNGIEVMLGRDETDVRLQRFLRYYPGLAARAGEIEYVDMRYPNGFAVAWRERKDTLG